MRRILVSGNIMLVTCKKNYSAYYVKTNNPKIKKTILIKYLLSNVYYLF